MLMIRSATCYVAALALLWSAPALVVPAFAETDRGAAQLRFIVTHPFKTVEGHCADIRFISGVPPKLHKTAGRERVQLDLPLSVSCEVASMTTGNSNRDSHMLEVLRYPIHRQIVVRLGEVESLPDVQSYRLRGWIQIAGIERPLASEARVWLGGRESAAAVTAAQSDSVANVRGSFVVRLSEFGLTAPSLLTLAVADEVRVEYVFDLPVTDSR